MQISNTHKTVQSELVNIVDIVDEIRLTANKKIDDKTRGQLGQFMTPTNSARLLASKFRDLSGHLNIIDAGAGVGSLTSALVERALNEFSPLTINANLWEIENVLLSDLQESLRVCEEVSLKKNVTLNTSINSVDFIKNATAIIKNREHVTDSTRFNKAILNPPYLKISSLSEERKLLRSVGIETGNLYSCFVALALMLLEDGGELVAITPRSFCNGPYFNDFRKLLLNRNNLAKLHVFDSRTSAFKGDKVLQENVIFHIIKNEPQGKVEVVTSTCAEDPNPLIRFADFNEVVNKNNPDSFIHIVSTDEQAEIAKKIGGMPCSLEDLGIQASTGKVVEFRTPNNLRSDEGEDTVPLIYPMNFVNCIIHHPALVKKKPNSIALNHDTENLMVPNGVYVLTKRLTSKEERRRIVAGLYVGDLSRYSVVGFENKTNYFHCNNQPLELNFAKGLWVYLNSDIVDQYFRQFNGHTQVNATDLRTLRYPTYEQLIEIGKNAEDFNQETFNKLVAKLYT